MLGTSFTVNVLVTFWDIICIDDYESYMCEDSIVWNNLIKKKKWYKVEKTNSKEIYKKYKTINILFCLNEFMCISLDFPKKIYSWKNPLRLSS